jgi:hypothetical protein
MADERHQLQIFDGVYTKDDVLMYDSQFLTLYPCALGLQYYAPYLARTSYTCCLNSFSKTLQLCATRRFPIESAL